MLTQAELNYLNTIPPEEKVSCRPYNPITSRIATKYINKVKANLPDADVRFMGASALEISGQGDIDIYVLASPDKFDDYLPKLIRSLGRPVENSSLNEWVFSDQGFEITIYLDNPDKQSTKDQIRVFEMLQSDQGLLKEYEMIKSEAAKYSFRDYQRRKYEFYHRLLD